jgi:hypothetical protein
MCDADLPVHIFRRQQQRRVLYRRIDLLRGRRMLFAMAPNVWESSADDRPRRAWPPSTDDPAE